MVCPREEVDRHTDINVLKIIAVPPEVNSHSSKLRWIFEDGMRDRNDKCCILDDDLTFSIPYIREDGNRRLRAVKTEEDLKKVKTGFWYMEDLLNDTALVGIHPRQMGHIQEPPYTENGKIVCVFGINRRLAGSIPNIDKFPIMGDITLNCSLLERGLGNKIITTFFIDWYPCQAEGGCSLTRTPEIQAEACHWLERRFGPYITAVEKEAKNGWLGGKRVDFRGRWKALYEAGAAGLLDIRAREDKAEEGSRRTKTME